MDKDGPILRTPPKPPRSVAALATKAAKTGLSLTVEVMSGTAAAARARWMRQGSRRRLAEAARPLRLCLGSGHAPIPGWINIDFEPPADILLDLRYGLPLGGSTVDTIYSEHLVEHLTLPIANALFREWRRVIRPDGVVRVATPDLEELLASRDHADWRRGHDWLTWPEYAYIDSPVHMLNVAMRAWGHLYLYDYAELAMRLHAAGFRDVRRVQLGESEDPALRRLETRADSRLIVEARA